jgi:hypothetical protein
MWQTNFQARDLSKDKNHVSQGNDFISPMQKIND